MRQTPTNKLTEKNTEMLIPLNKLNKRIPKSNKVTVQEITSDKLKLSTEFSSNNQSVSIFLKIPSDG